MRKALFQISCAVTIVMVSSFSAFASFSFPEAYGISTRSMAMGRAFTAIADNYAALWYNPAGLAQTTETTISINLIQPIHDLKVTYLESGEAMKMYDLRGIVMNDPVHSMDGESLDVLFPVVGISANVNRLLSSIIDIPLNIQAGFFAGLPGGFNNLFTTNTTAPDMPNLISFGDQIDHFMANLGLGIEIKKDLAYVGWSTTMGATMAGPHPLYVQNVWLGVDPENTNIVAQAECPTKTAFNNHLGLLLTPFDKKLKIGLAWRDALDVVSVDFTPIYVYLTGGAVPQHGLKVIEDVVVGYVPEQYSIGLAYTFEPVTISLDYRYQKWSEFEYTEVLYRLYVIDSQELTVPGRVSEPGSPDFEDVGQISVGLEYKLNKKIVLMGGYEYRPTQVPDQSYRISNYLDMDKNIFSAGADFSITNWMNLGLLFQYMMLDDFDVYKDGQERGYAWGYRPEDPQRSYRVEGDAFVIGLSVEFKL